MRQPNSKQSCDHKEHGEKLQMISLLDASVPRPSICVASPYCGHNSLQTADWNPNDGQTDNTHTRIHTDLRSLCLPLFLSFRLMNCDRSDRRDLLKKTTKEQVTPSISLQKMCSIFRNRSFPLRVCYRPNLSVAYGNVLPPTVRDHICSPGTTSCAGFDLGPDDIPAWPHWKRRPHLHNNLPALDASPGNPLELCLSSWTLRDRH